MSRGRARWALAPGPHGGGSGGHAPGATGATGAARRAPAAKPPRKPLDNKWLNFYPNPSFILPWAGASAGMGWE